MVYGNVPAVEGILYGVKPAVTAIVVFAAYRIGSRTLKNNVLRAIAVLAFFAIYVLNIPFPYIVLVAGLIGLAGSHFAPGQFSTGSHHAEFGKGYGPALIDDDTPVPEHAKFRWSRMVRVGLIGVAIWSAMILTLTANYSLDGVLTQMGFFFSKAALVTFGGAYAVLPYVYQGGVENYACLTMTTPAYLSRAR